MKKHIRKKKPQRRQTSCGKSRKYFLVYFQVQKILLYNESSGPSGWDLKCLLTSGPVCDTGSSAWVVLALTGHQVYGFSATLLCKVIRFPLAWDFCTGPPRYSYETTKSVTYGRLNIWWDDCCLVFRLPWTYPCSFWTCEHLWSVCPDQGLCQIWKISPRSFDLASSLPDSFLKSDNIAISLEPTIRSVRYPLLLLATILRRQIKLLWLISEFLSLVDMTVLSKDSGSGLQEPGDSFDWRYPRQNGADVSALSLHFKRFITMGGVLHICKVTRPLTLPLIFYHRMIFGVFAYIHPSSVIAHHWDCQKESSVHILPEIERTAFQPSNQIPKMA